MVGVHSNCRSECNERIGQYHPKGVSKKVVRHSVWCRINNVKILNSQKPKTHWNIYIYIEIRIVIWFQALVSNPTSLGRAVLRPIQHFYFAKDLDLLVSHLWVHLLTPNLSPSATMSWKRDMAMVLCDPSSDCRVFSTWRLHQVPWMKRTFLRGP